MPGNLRVSCAKCSLASTDKRWHSGHPIPQLREDDPQILEAELKAQAVPTVKSVKLLEYALLIALIGAVLLVFTAYAGGAFFTDLPAFETSSKAHKDFF